MKKHIPNSLTLANLFCGVVGIIFVFQGKMDWSIGAMLVGAIFDFFDGFAARLFNVSGELGKQLDSLADMVTSGVVPGIIMLKLIEVNIINASKTKASVESEKITKEGKSKISEIQSNIDAHFDEAVKHVVSTVLKA